MKLSKDKYTSILIACAAAAGYGGWAFYANHDYGIDSGVRAGIVQASYAFVSTFLVTEVAQRVYLKYNCGIRGVLTGFSMSFLVMLLIPLMVHNFVGTPDIWQTILPGLIWGSIYLLGFLISLNKSSKNKV